MALIFMECSKIRKKFVDKYVKRNYNTYGIPAEPLLCMLNSGGFFFFRGIF